MVKWGHNCFFGKTLCVRFGLFSQENFSQRKRSSASGKRGFHPCFCLPACCNCPVALSELTALILMIQLCLNLTASKNAIAAGKTCCKYNLLRKCGLLAHTSAAFLKNCCTEKLFSSKRRCFPCHFFRRNSRRIRCPPAPRLRPGLAELLRFYGFFFVSS